jgi:predicted TPR repeat methyltransferase
MADPRVRKHLQQGIALHQSGRFVEADGHYRKVLALQPNNPDALHMLGVLALQQGAFDKALGLLIRARNGYPRMPELHNHLGMTQRGLGRSDEALASFRTALLIDPRLMDAHANLADLLAARGALPEALAQAQHALRIDPRHLATCNSLGNILQRLRRYEDAAECYRQALTIHPQSALLYENFGNVLRELKDYAAAAAAYRKAATLEPKSARICIHLGATLERTGELAAAEEAYQEALRRQPGWSEAEYFLAALRNRVGQAESPATAPPEYVTQLFDAYASNFEQHLVGKLKYCTPQLLLEAIRPHLAASPGEMIDLGCGTGLLGQLLRPHASTLHGVDLSRNMLAEAARRQIYNQLEQADVVEALAKHSARYDAVLAADVLVYIGDLAPLYRAATSALRPGGLFAFTVEENLTERAYVLQPSRRYAHAASYLQKLATEHHLIELTITSAVLRQQSGQDIKGLLVVLRKPG